MLAYLLLQMDLAIEKRIRSEGELSNKIRILEALNSNHNETAIIILPQLASFWERGGRGTQHSYSISRQLKNTMYLDSRMFKGENVNQIKHVILPSSLFFRAEQQGRLRIGYSFVSGNLHLETKEYIRDGVNYFSVDAEMESERVQKLVELVLEKAKENQVDILLFPEMIGSAFVNQKTRDFLRRALFDADEDSYPAIIVLPSVWKEKVNSAAILTGYGEEVCTQQKQYPYDGPIVPEGVALLEDIEPDKTLYLLHCQGIGRMAIMICKDFLMTEYLNMLLEILRVSLILVPSMTTGEYDFKTNIHSCEHADCCVVQANCCSARWMVKEEHRIKLDTCGYCLKSGKNQNPRYWGEANIIPLEKPELCRTGTCEEGGLFWQDFYYKRKRN